MGTLTWRKRDGALPAVTFYSDDVSQATDAIYKITVRSGSTVVKTVSGIAGESWTFDDELALNGGIYFKSPAFEIVAQKPGFADSTVITIDLTR